ncbi:MAG: hypothetical protein WCX84_08045 [Syntrophales bacterium]|jgi:hypothetical protein|nr:hypothetical protein [Syntrophales bacterium]NLN60352.1 hypothetical protein [Deltaproteobacteria bacterium]
MGEFGATPETDRKVFDLVDVVETETVMDRGEPLLRRTVYELVDVVTEEGPALSTESLTREEIIEHLRDVTENIARELFPAIAERIIREEIAQLRNEEEAEKKHQTVHGA